MPNQKTHACYAYDRNFQPNPFPIFGVNENIDNHNWLQQSKTKFLLRLLIHFFLKQIIQTRNYKITTACIEEEEEEEARNGVVGFDDSPISSFLRRTDSRKPPQAPHFFIIGGVFRSSPAIASSSTVRFLISISISISTSTYSCRSHDRQLRPGTLIYSTLILFFNLEIRIFLLLLSFIIIIIMYDLFFFVLFYFYHSASYFLD